MTRSRALRANRPSEWWPEGWGPAPRYATRRNPERRSWGPNVGRMAERLGKPLYAFQQFVVDVAREVREDGSPQYLEVWFLGPRRIGKTFVEQSVVATTAMSEPSYIVMTAQTRDKAKDRWKDVCSNPITGGYAVNPFMRRHVKVTTGTGNERCMWDNGSVFSPFSPNDKAGHGDQIDQVWVDEVWSFDIQERDEIQTGYEPSGLIGDLQVWHLSAAGTSRSAWLKEARAIGRAATEDPESRIAYFEWSLDDETAEARAALEGLSDEDLLREILRMHPRRDHGLKVEFLRNQIRTRGRARVLRDYANVDADETGAAMFISDTDWESHRSEDRIPFGAEVSVGVSQDDERREATVAVGWRRGDGTIQTETVISRPGVRWAESYVADMPDVDRVAVVNARLGRGLADALERDEDGPDVLRVSAADWVTASQDWLAAITETVDAGGRSPDGAAHDGSDALRLALSAGQIAPGRALESRTGEPTTAAAAHILARAAVLSAPFLSPVPEFRIY